MKIAVLANEIEAGALGALLTEQGVPHLIRSYYDSVYDGLFQTQKGWGEVQAPPEWEADILKALERLRADAAARAELEDTEADEE